MNDEMKLEGIIFGLKTELAEKKKAYEQIDLENYELHKEIAELKLKLATKDKEIERLNAKYLNLEINYNGVWEDFRKYEVENAELQKQVDELKTRYEVSLAVIEDWKGRYEELQNNHEERCEKIVQQSVKDTVGEIIEIAVEYYYGEENLEQFLNILKKHYGVEGVDSANG